MSILNEDLSSVDIRNPLIPNGTVVDVRITKEEVKPTQSGNGDMFNVTAVTVEPVVSDLTDEQTGEPVMLGAGKEVKWSLWCGKTDKEGRVQHPNMQDTYEQSYKKALKRYGAAFKGSQYSGSLDSFSRLGEVVKAKVIVRETDSGAKFNEIKNFLITQ